MTNGFEISPIFNHFLHANKHHLNANTSLGHSFDQMIICRSALEKRYRYKSFTGLRCGGFLSQSLSLGLIKCVFTASKFAV